MIRGDHSDDDLRRQLPQGMFDVTARELKFLEEYKNRTGIDWLHYYGPNGPRSPPILYMHPADYIGQEIFTTTREGFR